MRYTVQRMSSAGGSVEERLGGNAGERRVLLSGSSALAQTASTVFTCFGLSFNPDSAYFTLPCRAEELELGRFHLHGPDQRYLQQPVLFTRIPSSESKDTLHSLYAPYCFIRHSHPHQQYLDATLFPVPPSTSATAVPPSSIYNLFENVRDFDAWCIGQVVSIDRGVCFLVVNDYANSSRHIFRIERIQAILQSPTAQLMPPVCTGGSDLSSASLSKINASLVHAFHSSSTSQTSLNAQMHLLRWLGEGDLAEKEQDLARMFEAKRDWLCKIRCEFLSRFSMPGPLRARGSGLGCGWLEAGGKPCSECGSSACELDPAKIRRVKFEEDTFDDDFLDDADFSGCFRQRI
ncbi:hypothetical protein BC830DRAFT_1100159 [Chytriomyces sp. MP71]|nr:hypothetical protein BC830DRAFT_1100159 [Chytriomyces sp. MP71]